MLSILKLLRIKLEEKREVYALDFLQRCSFFAVMNLNLNLVFSHSPI